MNQNLRTLLASIAVILFNSGAWATTYFVLDVTTSDANPELARSLKSLVSSSVSAAGGETIDNQATADFTLKTDLVKLGTAYVLTVTKIKTGSPPYSSHQKATSVEELDDAADRAVRAAILSTPAKQDLRVGEVKERQENQLRRRINSRNATYLGFGAAGLSNMGVNLLSYDFAIGYNWEVTPRAAIKILGNIVASGDWKTYFGMGQLGLNLFLNDEDSSPYLGLGFGFGLSASGATSATTVGGFAGNFGLGYQFFRTSSTQFDIFAGYGVIFGNNTIGAPGYAGLRIGILF